MFIPIILCGGQGTRLWPLSRNLYAKQIIPLISEKSLFQATVSRTISEPVDGLIVVCGESGRFIIAEQLDSLKVENTDIIVEPIPRGTAAAVGSAVLLAHQRDAKAVVAILPSDHQIKDQEKFSAIMADARILAEQGYIITLGVPPTGPKSGYGYMEQGEKIANFERGYHVYRFIEKPNQDEARTLLSEGKTYWNSGIFIAQAATIIAEMRHHCPDILENCEQAVNQSQRDLHFLRLGEEKYQNIEPLAFDVAVMERTEKAAVLPVEMGWSDLGSWDCLWQVGDKDAHGNVTIGDVLLRDVKDSYIRSQGRLIAGLGLDGLTIVETADAVLVTARDQSQEVRHLFDEIRAKGRGESEHHVRVDRPWGYYKILDEGPAYKCKLIGVKPGKRLSLQKHAHRSEHWVVVSGQARVQRDGQVRVLHPNQSTYLPAGCRHRLENPGETPLLIIEVQTGDYLGEDDIFRLEDDFGRP